MAYFTSDARRRGRARLHGRERALVRAQAGEPAFPVHVIGGVTPRASAAEVRAFVAAAAGCGAIGASLWELEGTTAAEWAELAAVTRPSASPIPPSCASIAARRR